MATDDGNYAHRHGRLRQKLKDELEDNPAQPRHLLTETAVAYRLQPSR